MTLAQASTTQFGLTGFALAVARQFRRGRARAWRSARSPCGPPHSRKSRVECQPPLLEASIPGCVVRRARMISVKAAFRSSAPGSMIAATGVANRPRTWISTAAARPLLSRRVRHEAEGFATKRPAASVSPASARGTTRLAAGRPDKPRRDRRRGDGRLAERCGEGRGDDGRAEAGSPATPAARARRARSMRRAPAPARGRTPRRCAGRKARAPRARPRRRPDR